MGGGGDSEMEDWREGWEDDKGGSEEGRMRGLGDRLLGQKYFGQADLSDGRLLEGVGLGDSGGIQ